MNQAIIAMPRADEETPGGTPPAGGSGGLGMMLPLVIILLFFMLMPLFNKREKRRKARLGELKKHDRVVTTGGIYGTIVALEEQTMTLEIAKDVRIRVKRNSIFDLEQPGEDGEEARKKATAKA